MANKPNYFNEPTEFLKEISDLTLFQTYKIKPQKNMYQLEFSTNWNNKLNCRCYTTIRIYNPQKHFINNIFEIFLNKKYLGKASIVDIQTGYLKSVNESTCLLDTGYNKLETLNLICKMYPKIDFNHQKIAVLTMRKIEVPTPKQELINFEN